MVWDKRSIPWNKGLIIKMRHNCLRCGKDFIRNKKQAKFCSKKCSQENQKGIERRPETIEKLRISHLGKKLSKEQCTKIGLRSKGHIVNKEMRRKISIANSGLNGGGWKGGITGLNELLRKCSNFRDWRKSVFVKDKFFCQNCGKRGGVIHPHHLKPLAEILSDFLFNHRHLSPIDDKQKLFLLAKEYYPFWDISNGITLCADCHNKRHPDLILSVRKK